MSLSEENRILDPETRHARSREEILLCASGGCAPCSKQVGARFLLRRVAGDAARLARDPGNREVAGAVARRVDEVFAFDVASVVSWRRRRRADLCELYLDGRQEWFPDGLAAPLFEDIDEAAATVRTSVAVVLGFVRRLDRGDYVSAEAAVEFSDAIMSLRSAAQDIAEWEENGPRAV